MVVTEDIDILLGLSFIVVMNYTLLRCNNFVARSVIVAGKYDDEEKESETTAGQCADGEPIFYSDGTVIAVD